MADLLGIVSSNDDPLKQGRIKALVPDLLTDPETGQVLPSPWCKPQTPTIRIPQVGEEVIVRPVYAADGNPVEFTYAHGRTEVPRTAQALPDSSTGKLRSSAAYVLPRADTCAEIPGRPAVSGLNRYPGIPGSAAAPQYTRNAAYRSPGGLLVEADDSPCAARFAVWHPSGAVYEVNDSGALLQRMARIWEESADSKTSVIGGNLGECVSGDHLSYIGHNQVCQVAGRSTLQAEEIALLAKRNLVLQADSGIIWRAGGAGAFSFGSGLRLSVLGDASFSVAGSSRSVTLGDRSEVAGGRLSFGASTVNIVTPTELVVSVDPTGVAAVPVAIAPALVLLLEKLLTIIGAHTHPVEGAVAVPDPAMAEQLTELGVGMAAGITAKNLRCL